jgi:glycosyltransferase involved in cell wall biosynthesis
VCGIYSTGRIVSDIYHFLKEQGHECCIAYGRGKAPKDIPTIQIGSKLSVYLHALYSRLTDKTGFASKRATKKLIKQIKLYQPNLIHLHNLHGYYINLKLLFDYLKESKIPVVWSIYDCWSFTGHCCHYDYAGCERWLSGCHDCIQKKEYPASVLMDHSKENYAFKKSMITSVNGLVLIPPTRWMYHQLKQSFLKDLPAVIIPSGIDVSAFLPIESDIRSRYGLDNCYMVLGVTNGYNKFKGLEYYDFLADILPDNFRIVLAGIDSKHSYLFSRRILILPRTNDVKELAALYSAADVYVNFTLQETQSITNIEALACGTGVVTFDSGGCPECVDESCGFVIKRGDIQSFAKAVITTCEQPFEEAACRRKAAFYDIHHLCPEYLKLYQIMSMYQEERTN